MMLRLLVSLTYTSIKHNNNNNDYIVKVDTSLFYGSTGVQKFLNQHIDVKNQHIDVKNLLDITKVLENKQAKMLTVTLKSLVSR